MNWNRRRRIVEKEVVSSPMLLQISKIPSLQYHEIQRQHLPLDGDVLSLLGEQTTRMELGRIEVEVQGDLRVVENDMENGVENERENEDVASVENFQVYGMDSTIFEEYKRVINWRNWRVDSYHAMTSRIGPEMEKDGEFSLAWIGNTTDVPKGLKKSGKCNKMKWASKQNLKRIKVFAKEQMVIQLKEYIKDHGAIFEEGRTIEKCIDWFEGGALQGVTITEAYTFFLVGQNNALSQGAENNALSRSTKSHNVWLREERGWLREESQGGWLREESQGERRSMKSRLRRTQIERRSMKSYKVKEQKRKDHCARSLCYKEKENKVILNGAKGEGSLCSKEKENKVLLNGG
nr:protein FAR1-RELATED SEQUENCE 5-like [Ipomoea batatas]